MLLGHWMEMRSIAQASGALNERAKLLPSLATRVRADDTEQAHAQGFTAPSPHSAFPRVPAPLNWGTPL